MTNKSPEHVLYTITKLNALICALQILYYIKVNKVRINLILFYFEIKNVIICNEDLSIIKIE